MKQQDIDKLFRDKLAQREHSYDPAYWQAAQQRMAASSGGRSSLQKGLWIVSVVALIGLGFLFTLTREHGRSIG